MSNIDPKAIKDRDRCRLLNPDTTPDRNQDWQYVKWFKGQHGRLKGHWIHRRRDLQILWGHGDVQRTCCNQIHGLFPLNNKKTEWKTVFLGNNDVEAQAHIPDLRELYATQLALPKPSPQKWNRLKLPRSGASTESLLQSDRFNLRGWLLQCLKKDLDHLTYYDLLPFGKYAANHILNLLAFQRARERLNGKGLEDQDLGAKWQYLHHALEPCSACDKLLLISTVTKSQHENIYTAALEGRAGEIITVGESYFIYFYIFIYFYFHFGRGLFSFSSYWWFVYLTLKHWGMQT